jgi:hypothetical protein
MLRCLVTLALAAGGASASAQTNTTLGSLIASHGSLAAGDVVFTNFRKPLLAPWAQTIFGVGLPTVTDNANVGVQANVAADGTINLVLTELNPANGLPAPLRPDASHGGGLPDTVQHYMEYDVIVTNPRRRLHAVDGLFGPGVQAAFPTIAQHAVGFYDATTPLNYFTRVTNAIYADGGEFGTFGVTTLPGGDRAGARFASEWGLTSNPGVKLIGSPTLASVSVRFVLADAPVAAAPVALAISSFFADAVYLNAPAPAGGATIALSSRDTSVLTVPASVTVPPGAFYSAYRAAKQPVVGWRIAEVSGLFKNNISMAGEHVFPGEAVGPAPLPKLTVTGTGNGTVVSSSGTINCGLTCSTTPLAGSVNGWSEVLTATAGSGSVFSGWTGACSGTTASTCSMIVNGAVGVGATFTALAPAGGGGTTTGNPTLTVFSSGPFTVVPLGSPRWSTGAVLFPTNPGTVTSDVGGINCRNLCSTTVALNTVMTLTAIPPAGRTFTGWSGACTGTAPTCTLTVSSNLNVKASFN